MKIFLVIVAFFLIVSSIFLFGANSKMEHFTKKECAFININIGENSVVNNMAQKIHKNNIIRKEKKKVESFRDTNNYEYGIWLWKSPMYLKAGESEQVLSQIKKDKFNEIYISVDDFLLTKEIDKSTYFEKLYNFIREAQKNDIKVDVVAGDKNWAEPKHREKAYKFIEMTIQYNNRHPDAKINKLQYDIEPYLLEGYEKNKDKILINFIEFIDIATNRLVEYPDIGFSVVLPHFYDSEQQWTPNISYKGRNTSTFRHIARFVSRINNSNIILMAYRNSFFGDNGVDAIVQAEFKANKKHPKLIIAQETKQISPAYVTFYGNSQKKLFEQLDDIFNKYKKVQSFGGIAVHDFEGYFNLK